MRRLPLMIFGALGVTVLPLFAPLDATANFAALNPGGPTGCDSIVTRADSAAHTYRFEALSSTMQSATTWVMTNVINPTAITATMDATPDATTDVWVTDTYYTALCDVTWYSAAEPEGAVGMYTCESMKTSGRCEQAKVRYHNTYTDSASTTNRRGLACHENGHSLGLQHLAHSGASTLGCMQQGYPKPAVAYSPHDRVHLNTY